MPLDCKHIANTMNMNGCSTSRKVALLDLALGHSYCLSPDYKTKKKPTKNVASAL